MAYTYDDFQKAASGSNVNFRSTISTLRKVP